MASAVSIEILGNHPDDVRVAVTRGAEQLGGRVGGGLMFLSGTLSRQILEVASAIKHLDLRGPVLLATGAGVLSDRGEHDQLSACVGILWQAEGSEAFTLDGGGDESIAARLGRLAASASGPRCAPVALFASREAINPVDLFDSGQPLAVPMFGGGTVGRPGAVVVSPTSVKAADIAGLAMRGVGQAVVRASPACQLLGKPQPVTSADGGLVLTIGSRPALDVLRRQASDVSGQRPVVVAVDVGTDPMARPKLMLRGIRGIHESREGVMVSEEIAVGTRMAFAVLDGAAAAADLDATLREMSRDVRGGVPRFGIYVDCAGRGSHLYGEPGVDVAAIRRRFPKLPFAGVKSAFEVGPGLGGAATHLYAGVFCLIYAPS